MEELLDGFLDYIDNKNTFSPNTRKAYSDDILSFIRFLDREGIESFELTDKIIAMNYVASLRTDNNKLKNSTIARKITALRSLYAYLISHHNYKINPFKMIKMPKRDKNIPDFLFYNELDELMDSIETTTLAGIRDRALFELMYATGMRVSECANLKLSQVNFRDRLLNIVGKGSKERVVPFNETSYTYLTNYINSVRNGLLRGKQSEYIFLNLKFGDPLTTRGIEVILENRVKKSQLRKEVHPHLLRHTFATHLLDNGADLRVVQELLGHSSLSTTQLYTHVTTEKLQSTFKVAHIRNGD